MTRSRRFLAFFAAPAFLVFLQLPAAAGQGAPPASPARPASAARQAVPPAGANMSAPVRTVTEAENAGETRRELEELLRRYSPGVGAVLKLDPALLSNPDYLAPYPGLAGFLAQHPEVARDPGFFFEAVDTGRSEEPADPRREAIAMWRRVMDGISIFAVFLLVTFAVMWLVRTLIDSRRWWRLSKVQADVHNKLLDRFASNDELLAYVQSPAGRRFLESAPIALDPSGPSVAAPVRRILWSVEAGFVMIGGGVGLQFVSGRTPQDVSPVFFALGVLAIALGIGFIVASAVSFLISKRLGILPASSSSQNAA